jgi:hypothetical protein
VRLRLIAGTSDFVEGSGAAGCILSDHAIASARLAEYSGAAYSSVVAKDISGRYPKVKT